MAEVDTRMAYGARCTWWDSIQRVGQRRPPGFEEKFGMGGLPCCPFCGNMLFEMETVEAWYVSVDKFEAAGNPGYRKMVDWMRGKCFPTVDAARARYAVHLKAMADARADFQEAVEGGDDDGS